MTNRMNSRFINNERSDAMRGYKINQKNGKWLFQLFPNNSNRQEVGSSMLFDSYEECVAGVAKFRNLILENHINSLDSTFVSVVKCDREAFLEYRVDDQVVFQSRKYSSSSPMALCKKCAESIYRYIDAYTLKQVF